MNLSLTQKEPLEERLRKNIEHIPFRDELLNDALVRAGLILNYIDALSTLESQEIELRKTHFPNVPLIEHYEEAKKHQDEEADKKIKEFITQISSSETYGWEISDLDVFVEKMIAEEERMNINVTANLIRKTLTRKGSVGDQTTISIDKFYLNIDHSVNIEVYKEGEIITKTIPLSRGTINSGFTNEKEIPYVTYSNINSPKIQELLEKNNIKPDQIITIINKYEFKETKKKQEAKKNNPTKWKQPKVLFIESGIKTIPKRIKKSLERLTDTRSKRSGDALRARAVVVGPKEGELKINEQLDEIFPGKKIEPEIKTTGEQIAYHSYRIVSPTKTTRISKQESEFITTRDSFFHELQVMSLETYESREVGTSFSESILTDHRNYHLGRLVETLLKNNKNPEEKKIREKIAKFRKKHSLKEAEYELELSASKATIYFNSKKESDKFTEELKRVKKTKENPIGKYELKVQTLTRENKEHLATLKKNRALRRIKFYFQLYFNGFLEGERDKSTTTYLMDNLRVAGQVIKDLQTTDIFLENRVKRSPLEIYISKAESTKGKFEIR